MKEQQDYIRDIAEMRSMMERSSRFLALSGMAGILAGVLALLGAFVAFRMLGFNPQTISDTGAGSVTQLILIALAVFFLAATTAFYFTWKKASQRGEKLWNPVSRRLLLNISIPLISGAVLLVIFVEKDLIGLLAPMSLLFYGLALVNASKFTYDEIRVLGIVQILLGLTGAWFIHLGLICWATGFGVAHIIYGIYMHNRYGK